jgi:hypothetical protein
MKRTWQPTTAGIICVVMGFFTVFGVFVGAMLLVGAGGGLLAIGRAAEMVPDWLAGIIQGMSVIVALALIVVGALPIIGGAYAIQRKNWGWALTGAIVAVLTSTVPGIVAVVLLALSRGEFEKSDLF